ncbi:MAG TPA: tRNA (adenosine(37)-N6)-dimethylallyltransferase MiaA [Thermomicrobiales bacterium]|nr:tRNA (adenosine(37)-N6)-dimethylallyltransferase MiaA [Thermomicrobiales bacterium]
MPNNAVASWQEDRAASGKPGLVVVAGPTAVGKTGLAVALAKAFGGEVVNADSRYLYLGFDIGVAKPTPVERAGVPHHLIDILPPDGDMSLARYQELAYAAIDDILRRGRQPILVGGTPLYVNAVVEAWRIPRVPPNPELRSRLEDEARRGGVGTLAERLHRVDPVAAERSGANLRRIVRALEIWEATGVPMSTLEGKGPPRYRTIEIGLEMPRDRLYAAIDERVADQIRRGLVEEVRALLMAGVPENAPAMGSLGYRQLLPYLRGEIDLDAAVRRIEHDTHRYVRHQETWLRRNPRLVRLDVTHPGWRGDAAALVARFLESTPAGHHVGRYGESPER